MSCCPIQAAPVQPFRQPLTAVIIKPTVSEMERQERFRIQKAFDKARANEMRQEAALNQGLRQRDHFIASN